MDLYDGIESVWRYSDAAGLDSYLNKVWRERPSFLQDEENKVKSSSQRFIRLNETTIHPRNYVGFVQYNSLRLNIYPKIFYGSKEFNPAKRIWHVLHWLSYARRLRFPFSATDLATADVDDWLEALIFLFSNYAHKMMSAAPHFAYQEIIEEMAFVRGSIAMPNYVRDNLITGRHHRITCRHEPFLYDNLFNRIVKHTCRLLQSVSRSKANIRLLSRVLFLLDEVSDEVCTVYDCDKVKVNRMFPEVDTIRNMCRMFLQHRSTGESANNSNLCLLLPMELIFEEFVGGFMERHLPELGIHRQASDRSFATRGPAHTQPAFLMVHDILIPGKIIIDTKYKTWQADVEPNSDIAQSDVYQVASYCFRRSVDKGLLLYPAMHSRNGLEESISFKIASDTGDRCIEILADELDIKEVDTENFNANQEVKFRALIRKLNILENS